MNEEINEETQSAEAEAAETALCETEQDETALCGTEQDETALCEADSDEEKPRKKKSWFEPPENDEPRFFGMPRIYMRGTAIGMGAGFVITGLAGLLFHVQLDSDLCIIGGAFLGYTVSYFWYRKSKQQQSDEEK